MGRAAPDRRTLRACLALLVLPLQLLAGASSAATGEPLASAPARPRIALVLSGGGARGFAHIGVLRVLRELQVPVDIVVGTSMGSVVGGAYAAGASVDDLARMARETNWEQVVADRPARDALAYRRREEDVLLPSRIEFGVHRDGVNLPPSAAGNAALEQALGRLLPAGTRDLPSDQLSLPFRSVASDLLTGEAVELVDTPLFLSMRASLAVPGVFAPVRVQQRLVVDGGLVRNLPVGMAHAMGADIVIAVNVGTPLAPEKSLGSALGVAQQMLNILTEQNVQRSLRELGPKDILIAPLLADVSFLDFSHVQSAIAAGEAAARALAPRLAALALDEATYAQFENRRLAPPALADAAIPIGTVTARTAGRINPQVLVAQSNLVPGKAATLAQVREAGDALYGRGDLARVETDVVDTDGKRHIDIIAREAAWATSRLRVGLELASDFNEANSFAMKLMYVRTSVNAWDAEVRAVMGIGDKRDIGVQFWQPLGAGSKWYVAPSLQYGASAGDIFSGGRRLARNAYNVSSASLVLGRELGNWGDLQVGVRRQSASTRVVVPQQDGSTKTFDSTQFVRYRVDTLDSLGFASRGVLLDAGLERSPGADGTASLARSSIIGMAAVHTDNWAGHLYGEWAHAQSGAAPLSLGGFLRLSGTPADSIQGRTIAFARLVLARRVGALPLTLGGTLRAGFSLETGGGFDQPLSASLNSASRKQAGSAFLAVDTRFGPAYLGAGATRDGNRTLYLFLGPIW
ncbi:patatin-like phospholipase family protein [Massilia sp. DWR3-1-1]|uniref:patatin-like phospholipase family protein n=1 Tax=Massilia sp. DWR3-1-1 TaxID=2804559 RepID=UPI003CE7BD87